jgi:hypothetical protein
MMKTIIAVLAVAFLCSCSSIQSVESPKEGMDGLTYFMPRKDLLVTVTVAKVGEATKVTKVTLGTTSSYPDMSKQYVLRHGGNVFGKNTVDVGVNGAGLLSSAQSTTVSNVGDVFKNLAAAAGQLTTLATKMAGVEEEGCELEGDHGFIVRFEDRPAEHEVCGVIVSIQKPAEAKALQHSKAAGEEYSGVFYRQNIPYLVSATGNGLHTAAVVLSPSESPTYFLPASRTFFANNQADFQFVDGIPTKYKQETEGELVALFKLPADVIGAYFTGIGTIFDSFKSKDQKAAEALAASIKLELAKQKYDACLAAIKARDDALTKSLGCE